jgi:beta-glucosidase
MPYSSCDYKQKFFIFDKLKIQENLNMMKRLLAMLLPVLLVFNCTETAKYEYPFQNPDLSFEERAADLLGRMTLEEKISQLNYESQAVDRLGVPAYNWWNECLHGVARAGIATVFPQAIGMAATWDKDLMGRVATTISDEGRAKYHDFISKEKRGIYQGITFWTPNINIFRDPRWGRGMETYGEDPYLTGELGVRFIKGIQGDDEKYYKAIATSKHFAVHNGPESSRHSFNAQVSEHDLRNTYLPAFEKTVKESDVASVMCAYNRLYDEPCCGNSPLLNDILRNEWGFDGYVVSDCWALVDFYAEGHHEVVKTPAEAAATAFSNGTDVNCGSVSPHLTEAVEQGLISEKQIDEAVERLLLARFKMGQFDPDELVKYSGIPYSVVDSKSHRELALEAARKSMVLLKNDGNTLPLSKALKKVAVIGPNANDMDVLLANYNGIPSNPITPLEGIKQKLPNAEIMYSLGCEHAEKLPTLKPIPASALYTDETLGENGLKAEFFDNLNWEGDAKYTRIDQEVDYYWWDKAPFEDLDGDNFSARWTGYLVVPEDGEYALGGDGFFHYELFLDDESIAKNSNIHHANKRFTYLKLEGGKKYKIKLEFYDSHGDANVSLLWSTPRKDYEQEAINIAKEADVVLMFMGLSPRLEGEEMPVQVEGFDGGDRVRIDLPDFQQDFIKKIQAVGKPTVLVMLNGSAVAINWENDNIPAILEAWYPGQAAGAAIADVLFGDYNPAGRLPLTFYKSVNDIPDFENYNMDGFTYRYFKGTPLYSFGYGLSYTTFSYGALQLSANEISGNDILTVSVDVTNSGSISGEEVVQLYIADKSSDDPRPIKDLRGFERIALDTGETSTVEFALSSRDLAYWNVDEHDYVPTSGTYEIMVGSSSADKDLKKVVLTVK